MLKVIDITTSVNFSKSLDIVKKWAKSVGYKKADVYTIINAKDFFNSYLHDYI